MLQHREINSLEPVKLIPHDQRTCLGVTIFHVSFLIILVITINKKLTETKQNLYSNKGQSMSVMLGTWYENKIKKLKKYDLWTLPFFSRVFTINWIDVCFSPLSHFIVLHYIVTLQNVSLRQFPRKNPYLLTEFCVQIYCFVDRSYLPFDIFIFFSKYFVTYIFNLMTMKRKWKWR